jgi:hypothetical protein
MQLSPTVQALARAAAGLSLGLCGATAAQASTAPTDTVVSFKLLDYVDSQPGFKRMSIRAPSLGVVTPLGEYWSLVGSAVTDAVSGASPAYYSVVNSAQRIDERRNAADARLTRHWSHSSASVGVAVSSEPDYRSRVLSTGASFQTPDRNTTFSLAAGHAEDRILPLRRGVRIQSHKRVTDVLFGVTQVLTPVDIVQLNVTHAYGRGDYSDPYKLFDKRPDVRRQTAVLARWNHHFRGPEATLRLSARDYRDSFDIRSRTYSAEWVQALPGGFSISPLWRAHRQTAASFYSPPDLADPEALRIPPGLIPGRSILSFDQRLSAFKARTVGLRVAWKVNAHWTTDLRVERYQQRSNETPFDARFAHWGLSRSF